MGVVYRGEDTRLGRPVALKFLPQELSEDRQALERMHREARAASSLNHPNICTIHDVADHEGQPFLVMELLDGQTLRERILADPLRTEEVIEFGIQIADALDMAHKQGVIHRDIKPANLFVTRTGQVKILDFGIAKLEVEARLRHTGTTTGTATVTQTADETLTKSGATVGTLAYMSPEQARGQRLDGRSDIFALGVVLYEMATGKRAFFGDTTAVIFDQILNRAPESVMRLNPRVPTELERIIEKALEKDRELRYQTSSELRTDLRRLKRDLESGRVRLRTGGRKRRIAFAAAAALLLGVLAAGFPLGWYGGSSTSGTLALQSRALTANAVTLPVLDAAISPDGKYLAYLDSTGVFVQLIGAGETHRLSFPASLRGQSLSWFPDGARLLLAASEREGSEGSLWTASILGGEPRRLRDDASAGVVSPDGSQVAFLPGRGGREIWIVSSAGGEPRRIATAPVGSVYGRLAWTQDGTRIVASGWKSGSSTSIGFLESHRVDGQQVSILTESPTLAATVESGLWCTADGGVLYCMAELPPHQTDVNLWWIRMNPRTGGPAGQSRRITDWAGIAVSAPTLSIDGSRMGILKSRARSDVVIAELEDGGTRLGGVRAITTGPADNFPTGWKPDGSAVLFMSDAGGTFDVLEQRLKGGAPEPIVSRPDNEGGAFYTHDPEEILYWMWGLNDGREAFNAKLMRLPADGTKARPVLVARRRLVSITCSQKAGAPCVALVMEPPKRRLVIADLDPVKETLTEKASAEVDPDQWFQWSCSPDGQRIALLGSNGRIRLLQSDGSLVRDITVREWGDGLRSIAWSSDGSRFFGAWRAAGAYGILSISLDGQAESIWDTTTGSPGDIICAPDGRRLAFSRVELERNAYLVDGVHFGGATRVAAAR